MPEQNNIAIRAFESSELPSKKFYDCLDYITLEETFLEVENNKRLDFYKMEKVLMGSA